MRANPEAIKMVLVVRADLNMRRGKEDAQCGHAALAPWGRQIQSRLHSLNSLAGGLDALFGNMSLLPVVVRLNKKQAAWFLDIYTKIVLVVDSEDELYKVAELYREAGIDVDVVVDSGATEVPPNTPTCLVAGPDYASVIDSVTGKDGKHPLRLR